MQVTTSKGQRTAYVDVDGVTSVECPVSLLTRDPADKSRDLVNIWSQASAAKEFLPLGPADKWPGAYYDVHVLLSREKLIHDSAIEAARYKATT